MVLSSHDQLIAFLFVAYRWVLPAAAEYAAMQVPLTWEERLDAKRPRSSKNAFFLRHNCRVSGATR